MQMKIISKPVPKTKRENSKARRPCLTKWCNHARDLILDRLERIESVLSSLVELRTVKDFYSTAEVGAILGKAEATVREWCRCHRCRGEKRRSGRGKYQSWVISREELQRIEREGLLPPED